MGIPIKEKQCKGTGKAKGFDACGTMTFKRTYGLCPSCYASWLLNTPEGKEKLQKTTLKITKPKRDLQKAINEKKEQSSLSYLKQNTVNACHEYIKLRDKGKPCVSCGQPWNKEHQAGHFYKAELYSNLKYDEFNIHNQCVGCNIHKNGNEQKYRERILLRISTDELDRLDRDAAEYKVMNFKWDRENLKQIRDYYKKKLKDLKNSLDL
jgi:hypothetical protein